MTTEWLCLGRFLWFLVTSVSESVSIVLAPHVSPVVLVWLVMLVALKGPSIVEYFGVSLMPVLLSVLMRPLHLLVGLKTMILLLGRVSMAPATLCPIEKSPFELGPLYMKFTGSVRCPWLYSIRPLSLPDRLQQFLFVLLRSRSVKGTRTVIRFAARQWSMAMRPLLSGSIEPRVRCRWKRSGLRLTA